MKEGLGNHLNSQLQDFDALVVPASHALAYGYFKNFVKPLYEGLQGGKVDLSDYKLPNINNKGNQDEENVVDFPTPLIALNDFVESEISDEIHETSAEYWQKQKTIQDNEFFGYLESLIQKAGIKHPFVSYFDYNNSPDFKLPD